jgi:hypothetical protein
MTDNIGSKSVDYIRNRRIKLMKAETLPRKFLDRRYETVSSLINLEEEMDKYRRDVMRDRTGDNVINDIDDTKRHTDKTKLKMFQYGQRYDHYPDNPESNFSDMRTEPELGLWDQQTVNYNKKVHDDIKKGRYNNTIKHENTESGLTEPSNPAEAEKARYESGRDFYKKRYKNFTTQDVKGSNKTFVYVDNPDSYIDKKHESVNNNAKYENENISTTTLISDNYPFRGDIIADQEFQIGKYITLKRLNNQVEIKSYHQYISDLISEFKKDRYIYENNGIKNVTLINLLTKANSYKNYKNDEKDKKEELTQEYKEVQLKSTRQKVNDVIQLTKQYDLSKDIKQRKLILNKIDIKLRQLCDSDYRIKENRSLLNNIIKPVLLLSKYQSYNDQKSDFKDKIKVINIIKKNKFVESNQLSTTDFNHEKRKKTEENKESYDKMQRFHFSDVIQLKEQELLTKMNGGEKSSFINNIPLDDKNKTLKSQDVKDDHSNDRKFGNNAIKFSSSVGFDKKKQINEEDVHTDSI